MLSLFKSERFQQEFAEYKKIINDLENPEVKKELEVLVKQLVGEVQHIDTGHVSIIQKNELTSNLGEARTRLTDIRKKISKIVNDYKKERK